MSKNLSDTINILDSKSKDGKIAKAVEIGIRIGEANASTPLASTSTMTSIKSTKEEEKELGALIDNNTITIKPNGSKPRLIAKEYMSSQKLYDVLKDPESDITLKNAMSLKTNIMKSKNKRARILFPPYINVAIKQTNSAGAINTKPTVTFKISTDDSVAVVPTTSVVKDTTVITNTTVPTIISSTTLLSTIKPTELNEISTNSVVMPIEMEITESQPPKTTTMTTDFESSTCNNTSTSSMAILATNIDEKTNTNTAPSVAPSANTMKFIAINSCNNISNVSTSSKESLMRSVHIPLSIASRVQKSIPITGHKIPVHPLIKSHNCALLSTTSNKTDNSKGIIEFTPRNSWPLKYDECDDSNSSDAINSKELEEVTKVDTNTVGKEVLVITTDINTKKTAVNIPIAPLVGKRKYTDPATMPILSFSYQKSLAGYIRKAKEFHKRAKTTATGKSNSNDKDSVKNMISTDINSVNTKDGSDNNDNTFMKCDDESNVEQKIVTAIGAEEMVNIESENRENVTYMETAEGIENVKDMVSTRSIDSLTNVEAAEDIETPKDMESDESVDNIKNISTTGDIESDLFTYEIFNNVSGISNASSRNEHTQTRDSTIKILKNIFALKEKVQQQAEEIMSLKAAMKLLKTPNMLNKC